MVALQKLREHQPGYMWTWRKMDRARQEVINIENKGEEFGYHGYSTKRAIKGDRGTMEFFQIVNQKKNHSTVRKLRREDGMTTHNLAEMQEVLTRFYK